MSKLSVSPAFSKQALSSHSWLGLLVGIFMYLVCLSGTIAVFGQELLRWEQPQVADSVHYEPEAIQAGYEQLLREDAEARSEDHIVIRLPTIDLPRASVSTHDASWYINGDGTLGERKAHPVTDFISELHASLHLPESIGETLVSVLGAMLAALIVSGVFAHRRIFKDAFSWRRQGNTQRKEVDLHNRLSVWGLPFHLMIALTGAYFGLASFMTANYADAIYDGDQMAVFADIYGGVPKVEQDSTKLDIPAALANLEAEVAPGTQPIFITVEGVGTPEQFMLIGSQHMDRLIYSEQYRFDSSGRFIDQVGYDGGQAGQAAIFSVYRLHFGHFGSEFVKFLYGLLGLALTVISVSGINLWLQKRGKQDALNHLWLGLVWGTPLAVTLAALLQFVFALPIMLTFWGALVALLVLALRMADLVRCKRVLVLATVLALALLVLVHVWLFGPAALAGNALLVNAALLLTAAALARYART